MTEQAPYRDKVRATPCHWKLEGTDRSTAHVQIISEPEKQCNSSAWRSLPAKAQ